MSGTPAEISAVVHHDGGKEAGEELQVTYIALDRRKFVLTHIHEKSKSKSTS
jgi:hypothetical protein